MRHLFFFPVVVIAFLLPSAGVAGEIHPTSPEYTVVDLGTLGGTVSQATGLDHPGVVSGLATTSGGATHAVLW